MEGLRTSGVRASPMTCGLVVVAALVVLLGVSAAAQDTVHIANSSSAQGYAEWSGRVLDYTGRELLLQLPNGPERRFPADQVLRIETQHSPQQVEADRRFAAGEYASALALYGQARATDTRPWVRRQITAQMVWCHQALGQFDSAGEEFLVLIQSDPNTPYFACIPLAWVPSQLSAKVERAAREWLKRDAVPAAVLLGASYLMSTGLPGNAVDTLRQLATNPDPRIAFLALAQTWRAAVVTADERQLEAWGGTVERMPEPLRAGPYYVLGLAWAHQGQWDRAALAWLRIPILYPEHRVLAARSLLDAGRSLEKLSRSEQAARLYSELVNTYPKTPSEREARARLAEMAEMMIDE